MKTNTNPYLVFALVVVAGLFLLFGGGAMTGTLMNSGWMGTDWGAPGGMMGTGWQMMTNGPGGISWLWLPALMLLGIGFFLGWLLFAKSAPAPSIQ